MNNKTTLAEVLQNPADFHEKEIRVLKFHPQPRWVMFSFLVTLFLAAFAPFFFSYKPSDLAILGFILVYSFLAILFIFIPLIRFAARSTTITNKKIVIKKGIFSRETNEIYLSQLSEMLLRRTIPQRLLKSGDIVIHTTTGATNVLKDIPNCVAVANALQELLSQQTVR